MGRGPMGGMVGGEKAKNFGKSFRQMLEYMGGYKIAVFVVMVFLPLQEEYT